MVTLVKNFRKRGLCDTGCRPVGGLGYGNAGNWSLLSHAFRVATKGLDRCAMPLKRFFVFARSLESQVSPRRQARSERVLGGLRRGREQPQVQGTPDVVCLISNS